jgi:hypothetical protein
MSEWNFDDRDREISKVRELRSKLAVAQASPQSDWLGNVVDQGIRFYFDLVLRHLLRTPLPKTSHQPAHFQAHCY